MQKRAAQFFPGPPGPGGAGAEPCPGTEFHPLRCSLGISIPLDRSGSVPAHPEHLPAASGCEMLPVPPGNPQQNHTAPDFRWDGRRDRGWDWTLQGLGSFKT